MTKETKWKLIAGSVVTTCVVLGLSIILFSLSAVMAIWQYTNHEFFWWTIPHGIVAAIVAAIGFGIAIAPMFFGKFDKKITYRF